MMHSYGLFWKNSDVFWGRQKVPGSLLGAASRSPKAVPVDFRDQRGIYALYSEYELVYVGQTGSGDQRLLNRLRLHMSNHLAERWDRFSWFGTQWVTKKHELSTDTKDVHKSIAVALNTIEAVAIAISEPKLNLKRGTWSEATQYFQCWDSRMDDK